MTSSPFFSVGTVVKLSISYSFEQEISFVQETIRKYDWYLEQGYPAEIIKLPVHLTKEATPTEIAAAVGKEYEEGSYTEGAQYLQDAWSLFQSGLREMKNNPSLDLKDLYEIVLTKYGTGGNYNTAKSRVTLLMQKDGGAMAAITAHEITHMTIQKYINEYNVPHWYKERLVDLLVEHYFPGKKKMQRMNQDVISVVDSAFTSSFPDVEAVARALGTV